MSTYSNKSVNKSIIDDIDAGFLFMFIFKKKKKHVKINENIKTTSNSIYCNTIIRSTEVQR